MTATVSLEEQATEIEIHYMGLRDLHARARDGRFKRPAHEIERLAQRRDIAEIAANTLRELSKKENG